MAVRIKLYEDVSPATANAPIDSVASNQKATSILADIGGFKPMSQTGFSNRGNSKFNGAQRSLIFRKDANKALLDSFLRII